MGGVGRCSQCGTARGENAKNFPEVKGKNLVLRITNEMLLIAFA